MSKKNWSGKEMLYHSRWKSTLPSFTMGQRKRLIARVDELLRENREYATSGNYSHLSNLFTALALYEMYQDEGKSKKEALNLTARPMWRQVKKGAGAYQKLFRIPGALKAVGVMMKKGSEHWNAYGWKYTFESTTAQCFRMTCRQCIYHDIYRKYGVPELGQIFCYADRINYGSLPGYTFTRKHTLCRDGQPCDFTVTRDR